MIPTMARLRKLDLTRRAFAATFTLPALAQTPPSPPVDELAAAREALKTNREQMAKTKVPVSIEPAFQFKV